MIVSSVLPPSVADTMNGVRWLYVVNSGLYSRPLTECKMSYLRPMPNSNKATGSVVGLFWNSLLQVNFKGPGKLSRYSDWLRAGRFGNRIPVSGRFIAQVQTGPGAHPVSCTMGTGSFPGVKRPGRGADHPPLLSPRSRKSRAIPLPPSGPSGLLLGAFTFYVNFSRWQGRCIQRLTDDIYTHVLENKLPALL
jgi:hypothetical protein